MVFTQSPRIRIMDHFQGGIMVRINSNLAPYLGGVLGGEGRNV